MKVVSTRYAVKAMMLLFGVMGAGSTLLLVCEYALVGLLAVKASAGSPHSPGMVIGLFLILMGGLVFGMALLGVVAAVRWVFVGVWLLAGAGVLAMLMVMGARIGSYLPATMLEIAALLGVLDVLIGGGSIRVGRVTRLPFQR